MADNTKVTSVKSAPSCSICDGPNASTRYGAICCPGCSAFFARTVRKAVAYCCPMLAPCSTAFNIKRRCKACRFRKCLDKQMRLPPKPNRAGSDFSPKFLAEPSSSSALEKKPETPASTVVRSDPKRSPVVIDLTKSNSDRPERGSLKSNAKLKNR